MSLEKPFNLKLKYTAKNCSFHPSENQFITADILGKIRLYKYVDNEHVNLEHIYKLSNTFVNDICYSVDGKKIFVSDDNSRIFTIDLNNNTTGSFETRTKKFPPKSLFPLNEFSIASSHENGAVCIWDLRSNEISSKLTFESNNVMIKASYDKNILVCCENPGYLYSYSLNDYKLLQKSEFKNLEISDISFFDNDDKFLVSLLSEEDGEMNIFTVGKWCDPSDHIFLGIRGIEHIITLPDRQIVVTDNTGFIGLYNIFPSHLIGYYSELSGSYYYSMKISHDNKIIMTLDDEKIKFWNVEKDLLPIKDQNNNLSKKLKVKNLIRKNKASNFYDDL